MADRSEAGKMLVISGPSGCGKSSICKRLLEDERVVFSVSATTREPRKGEVDGRDYFFVTPERFLEMRTAGEFIECASVHGNMYGTPGAPMEKALADGKVYLIEIDVQGALQLKEQAIEGVYVFIDYPDFATLEKRLVGRGTDSPEVIQRRLEKAQDEVREKDKYDHVVINDDLDRAVAEVRRIVGLEPVHGEEVR